MLPIAKKEIVELREEKDEELAALVVLAVTLAEHEGHVIHSNVSKGGKKRHRMSAVGDMSGAVGPYGKYSGVLDTIIHLRVDYLTDIIKQLSDHRLHDSDYRLKFITAVSRARNAEDVKVLRVQLDQYALTGVLGWDLFQYFMDRPRVIVPSDGSTEESVDASDNDGLSVVERYGLGSAQLVFEILCDRGFLFIMNDIPNSPLMVPVNLPQTPDSEFDKDFSDICAQGNRFSKTVSLPPQPFPPGLLQHLIVSVNAEERKIKTAFSYGVTSFSKDATSQAYLVNPGNKSITLICSGETDASLLSSMESLTRSLESACDSFNGYGHVIDWETKPTHVTKEDRHHEELLLEITKQGDRVCGVVKQEVSMVQRNVIRALQNATQGGCPTSFIPLPVRVDQIKLASRAEDIDAELVQDLQNNLNQLCDFVVNQNVVEEIAESALTNLIGRKKKLYVYLVDDVTGRVVFTDGMPITLTEDSFRDFLKEYAPMLKTGMQFVLAANRFTGVASMFFPTLPIPHFDNDTVAKLKKTVNDLGAPSFLDSVNDLTVNDEKGTPRPVKLRDRGDIQKFRKFLLDNNVNVEEYCGLNPVMIQDSVPGFEVGEIVWTKFQTFEEIERYLNEKKQLIPIAEDFQVEVESPPPSDSVEEGLLNKSAVDPAGTEDWQDKSKSPGGCCLLS